MSKDDAIATVDRLLAPLMGLAAQAQVVPLLDALRAQLEQILARETR